MSQSLIAVVSGLAVALSVCTPLAAQEFERWELGVAAGYAFATDVKVENASGQVDAGLKPGAQFSVVAGNHVRPWLSGEARYTYRMNDLKLSDGGVEARFDGESHILHYDFVFRGRFRGGRRAVQPFVAAGAGIRYFRGTGTEARTQPLSRFAILTKTSEIRPLLSVGGGVAIPVSRLLTVRIEARNYMSPFPREVIAPVPGARTSGWIHDIVPSMGLSFTF